MSSMEYSIVANFSASAYHSVSVLSERTSSYASLILSRSTLVVMAA